MSISTGVGRGYRPMNRDRCIDCDHPMRPARVKLADRPGTRQHVGRGKCSRCYSVVGRYDLTAADWERMLIAQSGRCAACGEPMAHPREPVIDHNHATGAVRGLLCLRCNAAEGFLNSDPQMARALAEYMERTSNIDERRNPNA